MNLQLTDKQKWILGYLGAWFVLMLLGSFARADLSWGHTMLYLGAACLTMAVMVATKPLGILARIPIGVAVLIASLAVTVLCSVTIQNAIANIDPLEVWATCLHHTQVLVQIPWEIWRGLSSWWDTGSADAFRAAGCQGHHLFLALFFTIAGAVVFLRGLARTAVSN